MYTVEAAQTAAPETTLPMERLWHNETAQEVGHNLQELLPGGALHAEFRSVVAKTPLVNLTPQTEGLAPGYVFLAKNEIAQPSQAYKVRGATSKIALERHEARLTGQPEPDTIVVASTGNCAAAAGAAARDLGNARVVVKCPANLSPAKEQNIIINGVAPEDVHKNYASFPDALSAAEIEGKEPGKLFMAPYNCTKFMAGNATAAVEVKEQLDEYAAVGELDYHSDLVTYILPGGGGGYAAANIVGAILTNPNARIVIVQSEGCAGMLNNVDPSNADTSVDGAAVPVPGEKPMSIINDTRLAPNVDVITVNKAEVGEAMLLAQEAFSTASNTQRAEPAGALSLAGALKIARETPLNPNDTRRHVMVPFISGGNVTREKFHEFMAAAGYEPHEWARNFEEQSWAYANRPVHGFDEALDRIEAAEALKAAEGSHTEEADNPIEETVALHVTLNGLQVVSGYTHKVRQGPAQRQPRY